MAHKKKKKKKKKSTCANWLKLRPSNQKKKLPPKQTNRTVEANWNGCQCPMMENTIVLTEKWADQGWHEGGVMELLLLLRRSGLRSPGSSEGFTRALSYPPPTPRDGGPPWEGRGYPLSPLFPGSNKNFVAQRSSHTRSKVKVKARALTSLLSTAVVTLPDARPNSFLLPVHKRGERMTSCTRTRISRVRR